jgi:hypothetical protein
LYTFRNFIIFESFFYLNLKYKKIAEDSADVWVLCGVFFNQYYTIYDYDQMRIGFALSNPNAPSADSYGNLMVFNI